MRITFQKSLVREMKKDKNIIFITGDLGYSAFEPLRDNFPKQYLNAGVAEQNMMGVAAGMALSGKTVFAYSIATFASMRGFEQIRNDIVYHNLPVRIVGVGGGFSYGHAGVTHWALEDMAIMRALPNMAVVAPIDPLEVEAVVDFAVHRYRGPMYIRLGKAGEKNIFNKSLKFSLGKFSLFTNKGDVAIFGTGPLMENAFAAAGILRSNGISCRLIGASSVKPVDVGLIKRIGAECRLIVSLEEHSIIGGLGSAIAEVLSSNSSHSALMRLGAPDVYSTRIGSQDYLRYQCGLSPDKIALSITKFLGEKHKS